MACHQHTQQRYQNVLRDLSKIVVMVLQPHNSQFTIELLQDLQIQSQTNNSQISTKFTQDRVFVQNQIKFQIYISQISNQIKSEKTDNFNP